MLQLSGVVKNFGHVRAVDHVSLSIPEGQMVGIIGRSGAGKSTLLRLINRLIEPTGGRVLFEGRDIGLLKGISLNEWRAKCAMIFQHFNLVERLNVITNVLIGRLLYHGTMRTLMKWFPAPDKTFAIKALERLDMAQHALQRADTLSGGQKQRVAIAKALVQEPRIVLADEPIASLDPGNATKVMEALEDINRDYGITVVCNLHTLNTARIYCERIIGMSEGRVVFDGPPDRLTVEKASEIYGMEGAEEALTETLELERPGLMSRIAA